MEREKDPEGDMRRRFQEVFDVRYVLKDGDWKLVRYLAFGIVFLILTAVVSYALHLLLGIKTL